MAGKGKNGVQCGGGGGGRGQPVSHSLGRRQIDATKLTRAPRLKQRSGSRIEQNWP